MSQPRIFVSHSQKDDVFTRRFVNDLRAAGATVRHSLRGSDQPDFLDRLQRKLRQCDWLLLVLTPHAIASEQVQEEVTTALDDIAPEEGLREVIPVLAAPCPAASIPLRWDSLHRYDATQEYAAALAGVVRAVGLPPPLVTSASLVPAGEGTLPAGHFPPPLAHLGFAGRLLQGVEVITPPVCQVPTGLSP